MWGEWSDKCRSAAKEKKERDGKRWREMERVECGG
jgi:hypothetical protein